MREPPVELGDLGPVRGRRLAGGGVARGDRGLQLIGPRPAAGLELVAALEASGALQGYHLLPATRADLLERLGRTAEAADSYAEALGLAATDAERRYLTRKLAETSGQ